MRTCPSCGTSYGDDSSYCQQDGAPLVVADDTILSGAKAMNLGPYRLLELLGEGGMGRVYRAEHVKLGRKVALKMLRPEFAANPEAVKRFFAEARSVNQVAHPNIVEITDFFEAQAPGEETFLIMELLEGESLRALLDREPILPLEQSLEIVLQIADGLAAVHEAGIVHRDLKPDNVFLVDRGQRGRGVKLLDFGIAKLRSSDDGRSVVRTVAGAVLGTPEYMSPEQAEGAPKVDRRADIYALGVMLYEMVSGRKPITGATTSETLIKQLTWMPPLPSESGIGGRIPAALEALIMRSLAKRPEERPAELREVQGILRSILDAQRGAEVNRVEPSAAAPVAAGGAPGRVDISEDAIPNVVPNRTARFGSAVPSLEPRNHVVGDAPPPGGTRPDLDGDPAARPVAASANTPLQGGVDDPAANGTRPVAAPANATREEVAGDPPANEMRPKAAAPSIAPRQDRKKSGAAFLLIGLLLVAGLIAGAGWLALRGSSVEVAGAGEGAGEDEAPPSAPATAAPTIPAVPVPAATEAVEAAAIEAVEAAAVETTEAVTAGATTHDVDGDDTGRESPPDPDHQGAAAAANPSTQDSSVPADTPPAPGQGAPSGSSPSPPGTTVRPAPARAPSPAPAGGAHPKGSASPKPAGSSPAPASAPAPARSR